MINTIKISYSRQALDIINNLKEFNEDDFKQWFLTDIMVGDRDITAYVLNKELSKRSVKNGT